MGWSSWDCFGSSVTEAEVLENARFMAEHLKDAGWQYIVVDIDWADPEAQAGEYSLKADLVMNEYGLLLPAENRFPSAAGGRGFKPLADAIHAMGLKFGIHVMRGVPRNAVRDRLPVKGAPGVTAADIAGRHSTCRWNHDMYGVDMNKPGAQAWYDANAELYASWDIDYIKADDMTAPVYHAPEIEALHKAVRRAQRPAVISLSPGPTPTEQVDHLRKHAQLWRISEDFWDEWKQLRGHFNLCRKWLPFVAPGAWPDADMLPIGKIGIRAFLGEPRMSNFTPDERRTLLTLWSMVCSPLMLGGHLPQTDPSTLEDIRNVELIHVNQHSADNRELSRDDETVWLGAGDTANGDAFVAGFNLTDTDMHEAVLSLEKADLKSRYDARDLWEHKQAGTLDRRLSAQIPAHGTVLFRLTPLSR